MRGIICFSLIFGLLTSIAVAKEQKQEADQSPATLYNYSSDKCKNISDPIKLYDIAISLRDSKNITDQVTAVECMIGSAFRGYGKAEYELARMYSIGFIVQQNQIFAYRWAELALVDGYKDAKELRDTLEEELSIGDINTAMNQAKKIQSDRAIRNVNTNNYSGSRSNSRQNNRRNGR